ncbi:MAG: sigma-70 family RNA polymerase sigma factor [Candidatus Omnitrophica bacterium]|nr:sigma-70 family RNA polymerase sigma factor [Candidatus Omnitrophota bacterium]
MDIALGTGNPGEHEKRHCLMEWFREAQKTARQWIFRIRGECAEAEDLLQVAWLKMLERIQRNEPIHHPWAYWRRVIQNLCHQHARGILPTVDEEAISSWPDPAPTPRAILEKAERNDFLRACLRRLSIHQRKALILYYFEGKSYQEIAREMEVSVKAVERLLAAGRKKLRVLVEKGGGF